MTNEPGADPDIIFVSFDEVQADRNYRRLVQLAPRAKHLHGVQGIGNAYMAAARESSTPYFFFVDADNYVLDDFAFRVPADDPPFDIYIWRAQNPVNGLLWFNGGVKLLCRQKVLQIDPNATDFFVAIPGTRQFYAKPASETRFNMTPFSAWRAAFRECAKLSSGSLPITERDELLRIWQTVGEEKLNGQWCILGAKMGAKFGRDSKTRGNLALINDFGWLRREFDRIGAVEVWHNRDGDRSR